jgi:hypothetical protein
MYSLPDSRILPPFFAKQQYLPFFASSTPQIGLIAIRQVLMVSTLNFDPTGNAHFSDKTFLPGVHFWLHAG